MSKLKFIDLFSGIGGFRIPIQKLNGECVGHSEIDKNALEIYNKNFDNKNSSNLGDIRNLNELSKSDLIVGGVPCQAWSVAGKKQGFDDPRGKLWEDTIRVVDINKPKFFIFENVKGLKDPRNSLALELMLENFRAAGYKVYNKVLNSYDYGLPQNRDRLFIVGIRNDIKMRFEFPYPMNSSKTLIEIFDNIKYNEKHLHKEKFLPRDLFGERVPASRNRFQRKDELNDFFIFCDTRDGHTTIHSWDIIKTTNLEKRICLAVLKNRRKKRFGKWDGNPLSFEDIKSFFKDANIKNINTLIEKNIIRKEENGKYEFTNTKNSAGLNGVYRVFLPQSDIFSTITATENRDFIATKTIEAKNAEQYKKDFIKEIYSKKNYRMITGREAARLQGFPDTYIIHENDKISKKQFGNAVPTNIVYFLAKSIINIFK